MGGWTCQVGSVNVELFVFLFSGGQYYPKIWHKFVKICEDFFQKKKKSQNF